MRFAIAALAAAPVVLLAAPAHADPPQPPPPPYIDHTRWAQLGAGLSSLQVYPTPAGRVASREFVSPDEAWREVLADAPDADTPGMRAQFVCHWQFAEVARPGKISWNLEPWRPVVDAATMIATGCNPGAPEEPFVISRAELAGLIDHTLLKSEATAADVAALVAEAIELGTFAVCVSPSMVPVAAAARRGGAPLIAAVAGFPSGKHLTAVKADEAARAVAAGATEIDMVIDVGAALAGEFDAVRADVSGVRAAVRNATLKVIVESAALLTLPGGGSATLTAACRAARDAGADFVKSSTGFHPSGGASVTAVELMAASVGLGVKASGGIRTAADALAMLNAGATRLGLSSTRAVLAGLPDNL